MIFFAKTLLFILGLLCCSRALVVFAVADDNTQSMFTAVTFTGQIREIFQDLHNTDTPPDRDPATSNAQTRERICADIASSGLFERLDLMPIDLKRIDYGRRDPRYVQAFFIIYQSLDSGNYYEYSNPYRLREYEVIGLGQFTEYVFLCPAKNLRNDVLTFYHVSKEYNVAPPGLPYKPGHFVFGNFGDPEVLALMLAESPAHSLITEADFNLELYYLGMRKHIQPAPANKVDPLCKLISENDDDPRNHHARLCVTVSASRHIRDKIMYPNHISYPCYEVNVSFETAEGIEEAARQSYYERMTACHSEYVNPLKGESVLYISRAYRSNQVFIYLADPETGKIYPRNLSVDVSIVDELNSFDFVEN